LKLDHRNQHINIDIDPINLLLQALPLDPLEQKSRDLLIE